MRLTSDRPNGAKAKHAEPYFGGQWQQTQASSCELEEGCGQDGIRSLKSSPSEPPLRYYCYSQGMMGMYVQREGEI